MLFNSLEFLIIFFPVVTYGYFILPHRFRWFWLLVASCYFYMAFVPAYVFILGFLILVDYSAGRLIAGSKNQRERKFWLIASLIANLGVLGFFKYFNFLNTNLSLLLGSFHVADPIPYLGIILPIGLSFHTFQSMSYTIEVYRGAQPVERHLGIYALYVMFYPQLVAGPIERPQNLLHQFRELHFFEYNRVVNGLRLMAWGLFKKMVIADRLATFVDRVYARPSDYDGPLFVIATVFFAYQIYCDFSGYSDMAIGAAEVMGFKLMTNFKRPYSAQSIADFWQHWHISLSTWFRDYVYIPLGGNRVSQWRWQFNLMIVFLLSGLWHGANWTFVIWGALHGVYYVLENQLRRLSGYIRLPYEKLGNVLVGWAQTIWVFGLVCFAWIFFRATDLADAWYIVSHLLDGFNRLTSFSALKNEINRVEFTLPFVGMILSIVLLESIQWFEKRQRLPEFIADRPMWLRWVIYYAFVITIIVFGDFGKSQFIYFQF